MRKSILMVGSGPTHKQMGLNGLGPHAKAILQELGGKTTGLTVATLVDLCAVRKIGFPGRDPHQTATSLLQRLINVGAVKHPATAGGNIKYVRDANDIWFKL